MFETADPAVSVRAYFLWEAAGRPEGRSLEHWLQAEAQAAQAAAPKAARPPVRRKPEPKTRARTKTRPAAVQAPAAQA